MALPNAASQSQESSGGADACHGVTCLSLLRVVLPDAGLPVQSEDRIGYKQTPKKRQKKKSPLPLPDSGSLNSCGPQGPAGGDVLSHLGLGLTRTGHFSLQCSTVERVSPSHHFCRACQPGLRSRSHRGSPGRVRKASRVFRKLPPPGTAQHSEAGGRGGATGSGSGERRTLLSSWRRIFKLEQSLYPVLLAGTPPTKTQVLTTKPRTTSC